MKKFLAIFLSALLVFSTVCIAASAGEMGESVTAALGETVEVIFTLPTEYADIKSGSVLYNYDKLTFDYVDGSAKWLFKSMTMKGVDEEQRTGVFAFASAKSISGDFFSFKLKVKDTALYNDYSVSAKLRLNDGSEIDVVTVVRVTQFVEIDDETTPDDFSAAVGNINGAADKDSIDEALRLWNALTSAEKEQAQESYQTLLQQINSYNETADAVNLASESVVKSAFSVISRIFTYVSKFLEAVYKAVWN